MNRPETAETIKLNALAATAGRTYGELGPEDPAAETARQASLIRSSLYTSVLAFGVAAVGANPGGEGVPPVRAGTPGYVSPLASVAIGVDRVEQVAAFLRANVVGAPFRGMGVPGRLARETATKHHREPRDDEEDRGHHQAVQAR